MPARAGRWGKRAVAAQLTQRPTQLAPFSTERDKREPLAKSEPKGCAQKGTILGRSETGAVGCPPPKMGGGGSNEALATITKIVTVAEYKESWSIPC